MEISTKELDKLGLLGRVLSLLGFPFPSIEISDDAVITRTGEQAIDVGLDEGLGLG